MTDNQVLGNIEHIDPNQIGVETNVRTVVKIDPALVASIREFGVLEPVVCRRSQDGIVSVRMGQRRVLAAREAERTTVPAYIVEGDDTTVTRLVEQFAENEHRARLTEPERAAVFQQLAFEGLTVPQIAKQTGIKKAQVEAGITVAENEFAGRIVAKHEVTLDQAAALIEFEGDSDAVDRLVQYAEESPEQFAHELQRQRDNHARAELVTAEQARLTGAGFTILTERPYYEDKDHVAITDLTTTEGEKVTVEHLADVESKFAHVRSYFGGEVEVAYYVTDPQAHGFRKTTSAAGPMTDEQKAQRKSLIANNKAWDSADRRARGLSDPRHRRVRRDWSAQLVLLRSYPRGSQRALADGSSRAGFRLGGRAENHSRIGRHRRGRERRRFRAAPSDPRRCRPRRRCSHRIDPRAAIAPHLNAEVLDEAAPSPRAEHRERLRADQVRVLSELVDQRL